MCGVKIQRYSFFKEYVIVFSSKAIYGDRHAAARIELWKNFQFAMHRDDCESFATRTFTTPKIRTYATPKFGHLPFPKNVLLPGGQLPPQFFFFF